MHTRPRSLADTRLGENGDYKTGHDAMGPPASFQDGWHTTNVQDGRHTISITRNICQSGLSIFQNRRRVSADHWALQSGRNRQSLEALRAIQHCKLGARQTAEKSVGNPVLSPRTDGALPEPICVGCNRSQSSMTIRIAIPPIPC